MAAVASFIRGFFLTGAATALLLYGVPPLRTRYFSYGSRTPARGDDTSAGTPASGKPSPSPHAGAAAASNHKPSWRLVDPLAVQVPHTWFTHFYVLSIFLSVHWLLDIVTQKRFVRALAALGSSAGARDLTGDATAPSRGQVLFAGTLMLFQGLRRFYECRHVLKPSAATMPFSIYLCGITYYSAVSVAVWIDGAASIVADSATAVPVKQQILDALLNSHSAFALALFAGGSWLQYSCHKHLASLPKYTPPAASHAAFRYIVCPHYSAEVMIYVGLAMAGASDGTWFGRTLATVPVFALVALGGVSAGTREWERQKWGEDAVKGRWRILPGVW